MCIALLFLQPRHCSGMAGQRHAPAALLPGKILVTHCREDPSGVPRGGFGVFNPPPRNFEGPPKSCQTQPDCENC
jgi:hypothetical protein